MSKHINYGKTFGRFYEAYRNFCRDNSPTGKPTSETATMFQDWFLENVAMCMDDATAIHLFLRDLKGELTHIYVKETSLFEFLKQPEIRDIDGIKTYIKENGSVVTLNKDNNLENLTTGVNFGICLHIPKVSQGYVFAYSIFDETNELRIFVNHGMDQYHLSSNEMSNKKSIVYTDPEINEIAKFALNLISYIYCFPECLVDGAPHDIKTDNNHYLNTSEKVIEAGERAESGVVIPHFRCGYFKRLSSDFFKNKRGQIIFVHETIVNGQAKTLEEK